MLLRFISLESIRFYLFIFVSFCNAKMLVFYETLAIVVVLLLSLKPGLLTWYQEFVWSP